MIRLERQEFRHLGRMPSRQFVHRWSPDAPLLRRPRAGKMRQIDSWQRRKSRQDRLVRALVGAYVTV